MWLTLFLLDSTGLGDAENSQLVSEGLARQLSCQEAGPGLGHPPTRDTRPPRPGRPGPSLPRPIGLGGAGLARGLGGKGVPGAVSPFTSAGVPGAGCPAASKAAFCRLGCFKHAGSPSGSQGLGATESVWGGGDRCGRKSRRFPRRPAGGAGRGVVGTLPSLPWRETHLHSLTSQAVKLFPPALSRTQRANSWLTHSV